MENKQQGLEKKTKIFNFQTLDFQSVSTILAEQRSVPIKYVTSLLLGTARADEIKTYEQYQNISRVRHDAIHWLICEFRDIPFGEKPISSLNLNDKVKSHKHYKLIMNQTPDIVIVAGNTIKISELTVSRMKSADIPKITKYRLLVDILKQSGYDVDLEVIIINSAFSIPDREFLRTEYGFSNQLINSIYTIIENTDNLLHAINETSMGAEWMAKSRGHILETVDFGITDEDVLKLYESQDHKPFNSLDDLKSILNSQETWEITKDDDLFIDRLVDKAMNIESPLTHKQDVNKAIHKLTKYHEDNITGYIDDDIRSFMPLPYMEGLDVDSSLRSTWDDMDKFSMLKGRLIESKDPFLSKIANMTENIQEIKLTKEEESNIAIQGPGRRKFVKAGSKRHIEEASRWDNHWMGVNKSFNDHIQDISYVFSQVNRDCRDPLDLTGPGLDYVKICQSVYREININALRGERRRKFIVKPTGVRGLFVVLFPGPKLRTGENLSRVWFKVILLKEFFSINAKLTSSFIFKKLQFDTNVYHSKWLSTDANRLDHYLRCYDKILMAYACYCSFSDGSLMNAMTRMDGNTLGILIMIYMENKRSTSKMLQDVRYLVMTVLSMFSYYEDVLNKFKDPIRTPLQSYLLTKILEFAANPMVRDAVLSSQFGKLNVESGTGDTFDRLTGADINLPRVLTTGPIISFRQMLCEMYFTMLFNKNQDDPTHASFQILSKILEGEASLERVKATTQLHTGLSVDPLTDMETLINTPHKNQFSRQAIKIASKLQSKSIYNKANNGVAHKLASQSIFINKYLDEFATFKSSSTYKNSTYNPEVYKTYRTNNLGQKVEIIKKNQPKVSEEKGQQNPRRRCIEGVFELTTEKMMRSFDLIPKYLQCPLIYQVFKKNQIGGVREILILDIQKRVLINILESFSRVICNDDDREMLTHGDKKFSLMRDMIRQLKRGDGRKIIMNYNFDKTKWAPSFMPIQFLYMFLPFKESYPSLFRFIVISLIIHTNKKFMLPEKLIRVWRNDLDNAFQHLMDPNLQKLKERFLLTKCLSYTNESNMGQGILHYTSSFFHLCVISLRDEVYKRLCQRFKISTGEWRDIVSSDDSYTAHSIPMDSKKLAKMRIYLFMKSQEVVERVMNVWTSTSKSSISMLIYEFNSLFGSNLTMFPTTFKFALASVHPVNTDSFFRMVKESYISCRQIVENGGSLELYQIASRLNKLYCESIYHTGTNGVNSPYNFGLRPTHCPYQLGIYPISDPATMIMFGPECHNYEILCKLDELSDDEKKIFGVMHTLVETSNPEIYAALGAIDDVMIGVNRIEAQMGPIKRLETIKRQFNFNWDELKTIITHDPLLIFNKPKNIQELQIKICLKLYRNGASEALRTTAASIYYGRVAASVSAKAFKIPFVIEEAMTYADCVKSMLNLPVNPIDSMLLYPQLEEYKKIRQLSGLEFDYLPRNIMETQNLRQLQLNKMQQRINNSIVDIINHFWGRQIIENPPTSYLRDWINLQEMVPILKSTIEETLDEFKGDEDQKTRSLMLIVLRLMSSGQKPMKGIIYGPSSRAYDNSYLILKQQNMYYNATSTQSKGIYLSQNITRVTDKLSFAFNYFALSVITYESNHHIPEINHLLNDQEIEAFFMDNTMSSSSYKKVLIMLLYCGKIEDITAWSTKTHTIFHKWYIRSKFINGSYTGDYGLKIQLSNVILNVVYDYNLDKISLFINRVDNLGFAKELLEKAIELSGLSEETFFSKLDQGFFSKTTESLVILHKMSGFKITTMSLQSIKYKSDTVKYEDGYLTLYDMEGGIIMRTIEGLLHSNYTPGQGDIKQDIIIGGVSFSKLCVMRPFNTHFSVEQLSDKDLLNLLQINNDPSMDDLIVDKPSVSPITNQRLGTNYPLRSMEYEFSEMKLEEPIDDGLTSQYDNLNEDQIMDILLDSSRLDDQLTSLINEESSNFHDVWLDPDLDINLLKTMTRQIITYQPKKILERVLNIKYHIITALVTDVNMLNKSTIINIDKLLNNKFVTYSLIYSYDKQYANTEAPSPTGYEIRMNGNFKDRYFPDENSSLDK